MQETLTFTLFGAFRARTKDGRDLLPRGAKTRALIALLVTSETLERRRGWLQDQLWSDRGPEQRAASLRQALVELRKCWASIPDIVRTDRQVIALNPERVKIDRSGQSEGRAFLEDVKAHDPAFTAWLKTKRLRQAPVIAPSTHFAPGPSISPRKTTYVSVHCHSDYDANAIAIEQLFMDKLVRVIGECAGVAVRGTRSLDVSQNELLCSIKAIVPTNFSPIVRVTLESLPDMDLVFAGSARMSGGSSLDLDRPEVLQLCARLSDAVRGQMPPFASGRGVPELVGEATALMFTFEPERVARALELLVEAEALSPSGEIAAWKAQAYNIQFVERHVTADAEFFERVEATCRRALALAPTNSDVLAAISNARVNFEHDYGAGFELARRSIEINNANPLAWWAHSNALLCIGRAEQAFDSALKSQYLSQGTRYAFWADFQVSVVAAVLGKTERAVQMGERSAALAPAFRPPLRYLIAMNAVGGNIETAREKVMRLVAKEADFSVTRMIEDESYPIGIMRRYGPQLTESLKALSAEV